MIAQPNYQLMPKTPADIIEEQAEKDRNCCFHSFCWFFQISVWVLLIATIIIVSLGYKHKGFYKLYDGNQPRYTFRTINKNYYSFDQIEQTISKTFMRSIKRSYNYDLVIEESNSIDEFYELVQKVSKKDGFKAYSKKYYEDIFNVDESNISKIL